MKLQYSQDQQQQQEHKATTKTAAQLAVNKVLIFCRLCAKRSFDFVGRHHLHNLCHENVISI